MILEEEIIEYNNSIDNKIKPLKDEKTNLESHLKNILDKQKILKNEIINLYSQKLNTDIFKLFSENIFTLKIWNPKIKNKSILLNVTPGYFCFTDDLNDSQFKIFTEDILYDEDLDEDLDNYLNNTRKNDQIYINKGIITTFFHFRLSDITKCVSKEKKKYFKNIKTNNDKLNNDNYFKHSYLYDTALDLLKGHTQMQLIMNTNWTIPIHLNHDIKFLQNKGLKFICLASKNIELRDEDFYNEICIPNPKVYYKVHSEHIIDSIENIFQKYSNLVWNNTSKELQEYNKTLLERSLYFIGENPFELLSLFDFIGINHKINKINKNNLMNFYLHYFVKK